MSSLIDRTVTLVISIFGCCVYRASRKSAGQYEVMLSIIELHWDFPHSYCIQLDVAYKNKYGNHPANKDVSTVEYNLMYVISRRIVL